MTDGIQIDPAIETLSPFTILSTPEQARLWVQAQYIRLEGKRLQWKQVEASVEGAPPFSDALIRELGINYISNKNFGMLREVGEPVEKSFANTWSKVRNVISSTIVVAPEAIRDGQLPVIPNVTAWEHTLDTVFSNIIRADRIFSEQLQIKGVHLTRFGVCLFIKPSPGSYHVEAIHPTRIILPEYAKNVVDEWPNFAVVEEFSPEYLWGIYRSIGVSRAEANGWNKKALQMVLYFNSRINGDGISEASMLDVDAWTKFELSVNEVSGGVGTFYQSAIQLVRVYARNEEGTIDEKIISRSFQDPSNFIFEQTKKYKSFDEFAFFFNIKPGVEYFDQNMGPQEVGFEFADAVTQMDNVCVDQAGWIGTLFTTSGTQVTGDSRMLDIVPRTINDLQGQTLEAGQFANQLEAATNASQIFQTKLFSGQGLSGYNPVQPDDAQGRDDFAAATGETLKNYLIRHYEQLDFFWRWVFNGLLKTKAGMPGHEYKQFFFEELERFGFPVQLLEDTKKNYQGLPSAVRLVASRILGTGSAIADGVMGQKLISMSGLLGVHGRKNVTEMVLMQEAGPEHYNLLFPPQDQEQLVDRTDYEIDNDIKWFSVEKPGFYADYQDHLKHAAAKLQFLGGIKQGIEAGTFNPAQYGEPDMEPVVLAFGIMRPAIENVRQHIDYLQQDANYKTEAKELNIAYGQLVNFIRKIQAAAQSSLASDQAKLEKLSEKERAAQMEVQAFENEENRKNAETVADIERENVKTLAGIKNSRVKIAEGTAVTALQAIGKLAIDKKKQEMAAFTQKQSKTK